MNCQLYSGCRLGKRKPGIISDGEGLGAAAGGSIEIWGVGFCWDVTSRVRACEGDSASVFDLAMKPFGRMRLDSVRVAAALSGKEAAMRCARAWGVGFDLEAKKCLEAKGRDDTVFRSLIPSLATSVAEAAIVFFCLFPWPEPSACA